MIEHIDLHDPKDLAKLAGQLGMQCTEMLGELLRVIPAQHRSKFCAQFLAAPIGLMTGATSVEEMKANLLAAIKCVETVEAMSAAKGKTHH